MKNINGLIITVFTVLLFGAMNVNAAEFESCDQWATFTHGGFNVYNNIWGSGAGAQCLWANAYTHWGVNANHPNTGGVKSYPNVSKELSVNVDDLNDCTSTFSVNRPSSGSYCSAYDIWYNDHDYEVMLWMNKTGAVGPIGSRQTNVTVGGHNWDIYSGSNGSNTVYSFVRTSNTNAGTVDIAAISKWLRNNNWFGNVNLHKIEFGFEITSSYGGMDFSVTDYSLKINEGGDPDACQSWDATNNAHVSAARAYTQTTSSGCSNVTTYYVAGSNENMGTSGTMTTELYTKDGGQTYYIGDCFDSDSGNTGGCN